MSCTGILTAVPIPTPGCQMRRIVARAPRPERVSRIKAKLRGAFADLVEAATQRKRRPTLPIDHRASIGRGAPRDRHRAARVHRRAGASPRRARRAGLCVRPRASRRVADREPQPQGGRDPRDRINALRRSPARTSATTTCRARSKRPSLSAGSRDGTTPAIASSRSPPRTSATGRPPSCRPVATRRKSRRRCRDTGRGGARPVTSVGCGVRSRRCRGWTGSRQS
jgi:hypothetical protein